MLLPKMSTVLIKKGLDFDRPVGVYLGYNSLMSVSLQPVKR